MRTGTYNRFLNLWLYDETLHGNPGGASYAQTTFRERSFSVASCSPGTGMWSLAEVCNRMTYAGSGFLSGDYFWPRQRVRALGPGVAPAADKKNCQATTKVMTAAAPFILECENAVALCGSADNGGSPAWPIACSTGLWRDRFSVHWEQSAGENQPWRYLPGAEIRLYGNRIAVGQATASAGISEEIETQFYGIVDSVRISRGTSRYVGDTFIPYNPNAPESELIDQHVIFALNLGFDPTRLPGSNNIRYYARNRGWLDPQKSTEGLVPITLDVELKVATTIPITPWPPTGANIIGAAPQVLIDGYAVEPNDVVLLTAQANPAQNGLWTITQDIDVNDAVTWSWSQRVTNLRYGSTVEPLVGQTNAARSFFLVTPNAADSAFIAPTAAQEWTQANIIPSLRRIAPVRDNLIGGEPDPFYDDRQLLTYSNFVAGWRQSRPGIMFPAHVDFGANVTQGLYISDIQLFAPPNLNKPNVRLVDLASTEPLAAVSALFGARAVDETQTTATLKIVLLKNQRNPKENGVYEAGTGAAGTQDALWRRDNPADNFFLTYLKIQDGKTLAETCWYSTSGDITLGQAPLYFKQDEIFGVYQDDFCVEAYFNVAGFLHPAVKTTATGTAGNKWPLRYGQNMTLLDTYRRIGPDVDTPESGIRIYFNPENDEHTGRLYVDIGAYSVKDLTTPNATISDDGDSESAGWKGPALQSDVLHAGKFYHVAVTRRRGVFSLYIDGVLQDSLTAHARQVLLENLTTAQNDIRYRVKAFLGNWREDKTGYVQCLVRLPEFFYDNSDSTEATKYFNGAAGYMAAPALFSYAFLNLPANWPEHSASAQLTWPGRPIPAYPAPAHVYITNDTNPDVQIQDIEWRVKPSLRFPPDTIYADLATVDADATYKLFDGDTGRKVPGAGRQELVGLTSFIDSEPATSRAATVTYDRGIENVVISAPLGQLVQVTIGEPTTFNGVAHGFNAGDRIVFRFLNETTDTTARVVTSITHGPASAFNLVNHGFAAGTRIMFRAGVNGVTPTGLKTNFPYFVLSANLTPDTFYVSEVVNGSALGTAIAANVNAAEIFVSLVLNGITAGDAYTVQEAGLSANSFRVAAADGTPVVCFGPNTGQLYATSTPATFIVPDGHGVITGQRVAFTLKNGLGTLPAGLVPGRHYYVVADSYSATAFRVSSVPNGAALYVAGPKAGNLILIRQATTVSTTALTNGAQFIFRSNNLRVVALSETVRSITTTENGIIVETEDESDQTRTYGFSTDADILVTVGNTYPRGTVLAEDPATALPTGIFTDVYYYATNVPGTSAYTISTTPAGPALYAYNLTAVNNSATIDAKVVPTGDLIEVPRLIDGVPVTEGMRVLIKNQNPISSTKDGGSPDAGVYIANSAEWVRVPELNSNTQIKQSLRVFVYGGYTNANKAFLLDMIGDDSPAKDILPRNYRINATPLLFVDDENTQGGDQFEARLETGRCRGGDPRRAVLETTFPEINNTGGKFIEVNGVNYTWPNGLSSAQNSTADYWIPQAAEDLADAVAVVLDEKIFAVDAVSMAHVALTSTPASVDGLQLSYNAANKIVIFFAAQNNAAENGIYEFIPNQEADAPKWRRVANFSTSDQFFDGLYVVPDFGNVKITYGTVGFKLIIPPGFELGVTAIECYSNPTPVDPQILAGGVINPTYYSNKPFRLSRLYLPVNWALQIGTPPINLETGLPLTDSGAELSFSTAINVGGAQLVDDKAVFRIRTRCPFSAESSDVVGRYVVWRTAAALGFDVGQVAEFPLSIT